VQTAAGGASPIFPEPLQAVKKIRIKTIALK
jgi:hypothetical protein